MEIRNESKSFELYNDAGTLMAVYKCDEVLFYRSVSFQDLCLICKKIDNEIGTHEFQNLCDCKKEGI